MSRSNQLLDRDEIGDNVTTLGSIRKTPMVLYGIFVELLRQIYSEEIQDPDLGWVWAGKDGATNTDPNASKIWIDTEYKWNDEAPDFRPAIFISLQTITYASYAGSNSRGLIGVNLKEGEYDYERSGKAAVEFVHIGNTKGEGVKLAEQTLDYLDAFADVIRKEFCFEKFFIQEATPIQVVKEDREKFRSTVKAHMEWSDTWTLKLESPKLMKVIFGAGQRTLDMLGSITT